MSEPRDAFPHRFNHPKFEEGVLVAPGAHVIGDVEIGRDSSIWFNTILRGDVNYIRVGSRTNIQDQSMVHVSHQGWPTVIGDDVTIGHGCILHACKVGHHVLVGMGTLVLDEVEIGDFTLIGAGSLITPRTKIPSGVKAFGRPARVMGDLTEKEIEHLKWSAAHYVRLSRTYLPRKA